MEIELIFAPNPDEQCLLCLHPSAPLTAKEAIRQSGLIERYPDFPLLDFPCGIYGKKIHPDTLLKAGDRLEIYRPLQLDPKTARKRR